MSSLVPVFNPHTTLSSPVVGITSLSIFGLGVTTVTIVQLHAGHSNRSKISFVQLNSLPDIIGSVLFAINVFLGKAGNHFNHAGAFRRADICATLTGVNIAINGESAIDVQYHILQISIGTIIGSAGRICQRRKVSVHINKFIVRSRYILIGSGIQHLACLPISRIVNVQIAARIHGSFATSCNCSVDVGQHQFCALRNRNFRTRQQRHILIDIGNTRQHINGQIIGNGQHIGRGISTLTTKLNAQAVDRAAAHNIDLQTILIRQILLNDRTALGSAEHAAFANKLDTCASGQGVAGNIQSGIYVLSRAILQNQLGLNVLHIVLAHGGNAIIVIGGCHRQCITTTAIVHELDVLANGCTFLCGHGAFTNHITPGIQCACIVDHNLRSCLHVDKANGAGGRTSVGNVTLSATTCIMLAANTDCAINSDGRTSCQGQSRVSIGLFPSKVAHNFSLFIENNTCHTRSVGIACILVIKRNQQCNTSRNGVITTQHTAICQYNVGNIIFLCKCCCRTQVRKHSTASLEHSAISRHKNGIDLAI